MNMFLFYRSKNTCPFSYYFLRFGGRLSGRPEGKCFSFDRSGKVFFFDWSKKNTYRSKENTFRDRSKKHLAPAGPRPTRRGRGGGAINHKWAYVSYGNVAFWTFDLSGTNFR